jgi:hypothetical protein
LIKECKSLHKENALLKQREQDERRQQAFSALEQYVACALQIHERQLAAVTPTVGSPSMESTSRKETKPSKPIVAAIASTAMDDKAVGSEKQQVSAPATYASTIKPRSLGFGAHVDLGFGGLKSSWHHRMTPSSTTVSATDRAPLKTVANPPSKNEPPETSKNDESSTTSSEKENSRAPYIPDNFHTSVPALLSRESSAFKNFFLRSPSPQSMLSSQKRNPLLTLADDFEDKPVYQTFYLDDGKCPPNANVGL